MKVLNMPLVGRKLANPLLPPVLVSVPLRTKLLVPLNCAFALLIVRLFASVRVPPID